MTSGRAKIGFGDALGDLGHFEPSSPPKPIAQPEAAAEVGFRSREPVVLPQTPQVRQQQRRRRTGRNAQINIKARQDTLDAFYALVDQIGCGVGEAFEMAVDALQQSIRSK